MGNLAIEIMWKNTARNCQSWLIFHLNGHTSQEGWRKYIWASCHSVNNRPPTQWLLSSTDSEDWFPLFLIKGEQKQNINHCSAAPDTQLLKGHPQPSVKGRQPLHGNTLFNAAACRATRGHRCATFISQRQTIQKLLRFSRSESV